MMPEMRRWLAALTLLGAGTAMLAQTAGHNGGVGVSAADSGASVVLPVQLGASAVSLEGPWRFRTGDNAAWAQPNFNDAGWEEVKLDAVSGDAAAAGSGDLLPGWTARGHANYAGFAWYRLRVRVSGAHQPLSLRMPDAVDDAYQVFVNGQKVGQFGSFGLHGVKAYAAMPQGFTLPQQLRDGEMVIAIRVWMDSATRFLAPEVGGLRAPPELGLTPTVAGQVRLDWDDQAHLVGSGFLETLVLLLALAVTLGHFSLARQEKAYLWLALVVSATLLSNVIVQLVNFTTLLPQTPAILLRDVLLTPLRLGLWVLFWSAWFGFGVPRKLLYPTICLMLLLALGTAMLRPPLHGQWISVGVTPFVTPAILVVKLGLAGLLLAVAVRGLRRDRLAGLVALPALLLAVVAMYQHDLRFLHIPVTFVVAGFMVSLGQVSTMLSLLLLTGMGSWRFLQAHRQAVQLDLEVQQARELQQLIVPRALPQVPGLHIESDYRPSHEVGGDFFQVIPDRRDGSVFVLVGDVTGKGLQAGMLVALIVGAADAAARENPEPEEILRTLNELLCQRGYATATCLAMRILPDGSVAIANAGHLPPYLNGRELEMEGALPLGTMAGLDYTLARLQLQAGDALVLLTDGVIEAQNAAGEMLGFERVSAMLARRAGVRELADTAAHFGQEDDILVLQVQRTASSSSMAAA